MYYLKGSLITLLNILTICFDIKQGPLHTHLATDFSLIGENLNKINQFKKLF